MSVLAIGEIVKYDSGGRADTMRYGRVVAHEVYTDDNGTRSWWYVRWFCPDSKPDSEPLKHHQNELIKLPSRTTL